MGLIAKQADNQLAKNDGRKTLQDYIKKMQGEIAKALPSVITPERFTRIVLSAVSTNPKLGDCSPQSFLGAMMTAAQLGVEPNTPLGQAYLIPYYNNKKKCLECQFQLGYKGMIDKFHKDPNGKSIEAHAVYEGDEFEFEYGLEPKLRHIPARTNRGDPIYFYAVFHTTNGGYGFEVMSIEDVRKFAQEYSKSYGFGPWQTNFEEMAKKTVIKRVLKYAPMSTEFQRHMTADETIKTTISDDMFAEPTEYIEITELEEVEDEQTGDQGISEAQA